ncbi:nickel/cobalt efflux protein RcnA, partial [Acinetobacter baumannii]
SEPYFQLVSAVIIIGIAVWMAWRTWREQNAEDPHQHHHDELQHITARTGLLTLEVFEDGVPPRWRIRSERGELPAATQLCVETVREDG